jgi:hypothetical protein
MEKFKELSDIEVVARSETFKAFGYEEICRERIGNVEGKVADHGEFSRSEVVESTEVADEDSVGFGILDQAEKSGFTGLLDSRSSEVNGNL